MLFYIFQPMDSRVQLVLQQQQPFAGQQQQQGSPLLAQQLAGLLCLKP